MYNELLYYNKPANHYMEALPLGNGSLGALRGKSTFGRDFVMATTPSHLWTGFLLLLTLTDYTIHGDKENIISVVI